MFQLSNLTWLIGQFQKATVASSMFDRAKFFDACRETVMGPTLDNDEVLGSETLLEALDGLPISYVAYALATTWHETSHTMRPVKEYGGPSYFTRMYDIRGRRPQKARELGNKFPGDGALFAGRGYVQLTGRANYRKAELKTGYPLESNPDIAMRADIAAQILREGMLEGWFTGKAFASYLPGTGLADRKAFRAARRIINGTDKADMIAGYAMEFQGALKAGGW